jgi:hypothetical protein
MTTYELNTYAVGVWVEELGRMTTMTATEETEAAARRAVKERISVADGDRICWVSVTATETVTVPDSYRDQIRRTFKAFSDAALAFQSERIIGGVDREECDRELARRGL